MSKKPIEIIESQIKQGVQNAYNEHLKMTQNYDGFTARIIEYHLTTCIAQSIMNWTYTRGTNVELEYPIRKFYNNAFADSVISGEDIFNLKSANRGDHNPKNNKQKRIDIALTYDGIGFEGKRVQTGVEVKGVNKNQSHILDDVKRIANAMLSIDKHSDNSIEAGFSIFLRNLYQGKRILTDSMADAKESNTQLDWKNKLNALSNQYQPLNFSISKLLVVRTTIEDIISKIDPTQYPHDELTSKSGLVICYQIKITRK